MIPSLILLRAIEVSELRRRFPEDELETCESTRADILRFDNGMIGCTSKDPDADAGKDEDDAPALVGSWDGALSTGVVATVDTGKDKDDAPALVGALWTGVVATRPLLEDP